MNRTAANRISRSTLALVLLVAMLSLFSCKEEEAIQEQWIGSGVATYLYDSRQDIRRIRIYYYVPEKADKNTPLLCLFHGLERNASEYRNALIDKAFLLGFIVCVPEFSEEEFPGVNLYQLGDVFEDGEQASLESLNNEEEWTFSIIPQMLEFVRMKTIKSDGSLQFIGHSAGAQFLHRLLMFKPEIEYEKAVISAAGWYTVPDFKVDFPYGLGLTPVKVNDVASFFAEKIYVQVGSNDNNPNASTLRRTPEADLQGKNRLERASYFYESSKVIANELGVPLNWSLHEIPDLSHNFVQAVNHSAQLLFE